MASNTTARVTQRTVTFARSDMTTSGRGDKVTSLRKQFEEKIKEQEAHAQRQKPLAQRVQRGVQSPTSRPNPAVASAPPNLDYRFPLSPASAAAVYDKPVVSSPASSAGRSSTMSSSSAQRVQSPNSPATSRPKPAVASSSPNLDYRFPLSPASAAAVYDKPVVSSPASSAGRSSTMSSSGGTSMVVSSGGESTATSSSVSEYVPVVTPASSARDLVDLVLRSPSHETYDNVVLSYLEYTTTKDLLIAIRDHVRLNEGKNQKIISEFFMKLYFDLVKHSNDLTEPNLLIMKEILEDLSNLRGTRIWNLVLMGERGQLPKVASNDGDRTPPKDFITYGKVKDKIVRGDLSNKELIELARKIARDLGKQSHGLFKAIQRSEFIGAGWNNDPVRSVNIRSSIDQSHQVRHFVESEILQIENIKDRARMIKFFILLADAAFSNNDWQTCFNIIGALNGQSISRLSDTWKLVSPELREIFENHKILLLDSKPPIIYKAMEQVHDKKNLIPPLRIFLQSYSMSNQFANYSDTSINGEKVISLGKTFKIFRNCKEKLNGSPQAFCSDIVDRLKVAPQDEEAFYQQSLRLQPPKIPVSMTAEVKPPSPKQTKFMLPKEQAQQLPYLIDLLGQLDRNPEPKKEDEDEIFRLVEQLGTEDEKQAIYHFYNLARPSLYRGYVKMPASPATTKQMPEEFKGTLSPRGKGKEKEKTG